MAENEVYILYGSQTGQAESIAENIQEATESHGIRSTLLNLKQADQAFQIITERQVPIVFVCSTTGDGEVPGNARKFMRILCRKTHATALLGNLRYALLGLGDTNYSTFCGGPKTLERGLKKLGATSFYPAGFADDGTDLELVVEPWIEGLWAALKSALLEAAQNRQNVSPHINSQEVESNQQEVQKVANLSTTARNCDAILPPFSRDDTAASETTLVPGNDSNISESMVLHEGDPPPSENLRSSIEQLEDGIKKLSLEDKFLKMDESPLRKLSKTSSGILPPLMKSYIKCTKTPDKRAIVGTFVPYPLAIDENLKSAKIVSIHKLTSDDAVKTAYYVTLDVGDDFVYEPGDAFGVIVKNPKEEVDWLINRLNLDNHCDATITLTVHETMGKKKIPKYLPVVSTIRYILENCLELRSIPKRTFLRALHDFTSSENDRTILKQLCRKESMDDFSKMVREPNLNLLDVLASLSSCQPPFELLLEHLPRIKARLYSAASALQAAPKSIGFVFNVIEFPATEGRMYPRKGLFTGYMDNLYRKSMNGEIMSIFNCKNPSFRLPKSLDKPLVMIGPGTGVAPFIGFLEFLKSHYADNSAIKRPPTWLFFGCRHKDKDYLFRDKLEGLSKSGVLDHLLVAFSRHSDSPDGDSEPKYVQDNLRLSSESIFDLLRHDAVFYVCGNARNMAKDVRRGIFDILAQKMSNDDANELLESMVTGGRYKEDVWA